jgi:hypothetical protein
MKIGTHEEGSALQILYNGVRQGYYPPLLFLGIGVMTDFSSMLSKSAPDPAPAAAQACSLRWWPFCSRRGCCWRPRGGKQRIFRVAREHRGDRVVGW